MIRTRPILPKRNEYWDAVIKPLIDEKNRLCTRFQRYGYSPALGELMDEITADLMEYPEYRRSRGITSGQNLGEKSPKV